jgi:hypothetical protein
VLGICHGDASPLCTHLVTVVAAVASIVVGCQLSLVYLMRKSVLAMVVTSLAMSMGM